MSDAVSITREVTLRNSHGMHMRPAHGFMALANEFTSDVFVQNGDDEVNGKRMIGLMGFAHCGDTLMIRCEGEDAEAAADALVKYIEGLPEMFNEQDVPPS